MGEMKYVRLGKKYRLVNVEPPTNEFMEERLKVFTDLGLPARIS